MVNLIALFGTALLFGTSAYGFLMTPLIYRGLTDAGAAAYLRQLFPPYYLILTVGGAVAAAAFALEAHPIRATIMALVTVFAVVMAQVVVPRLVRLHLQAAGDETPGGQYVLLRSLAIITTFLQMAATGTVLAWFVA